LTGHSAKTGLFKKLGEVFSRPNTRNQFLGLFDQAVVSALSFVAMVIVARNTSLDQVGLYVLANSILFILIALQDSMVTRPYAVQVLKPVGSPQAHAGSALALTLVMSILIAGVATGAGLFEFVRSNGAPHFTYPISFGFACAAILLREFARRHSFSAYASDRALILDLLSSLLTLVVLIALASASWLTAETAFLALGFGSAIAVLVWWLRHRDAFSFSRQSFWETASKNWGIGRWFTIGQVAMQFQGYANHWIILIMLGASVTGTYGEAMSVVSLANPFIYGMLNFLMPKSVRKLHHEGRSSLLLQTRNDMLGIGVLMGAFVLVIYFFGGTILSLLYKQTGADSELAIVMTLLAIGSLIGAVGGPITISLQSEERGRELAAISILCVVFALATSAILIWQHGLIGAGWALVAAETFSVLLRGYLMFAKKVSTNA
jgi:O-antigen/teichoic acid export membrane protein